MADTKSTILLVFGMVFLFICVVWLFYPNSQILPSSVSSGLDVVSAGAKELPGASYIVGTNPPTMVPSLTPGVASAMSTPGVDPTTGAIMDGPGFEKGPTDIPQSQTYDNIPSNYYFLDDGAGGSDTVINNMCSKSCCSDSDWPTPFKQKYDPYVCGNKDKFVPSNYFCNNAFQDSGCLCMTKKQNDFLANRGNNGFPWV